MKPCLSEVTTLPASFAEDVGFAADASCAGLEVWLTKLETHLEKGSLADTRKMVGDRGLVLPAAAYQGGLLLSQGDQRKAHFDQFRRRLELCQALEIPTMLVVADFVGPVDGQGLERAIVSLQQAGQWAAGHGMRLALEFRSQSGFCASLDTAAAMVAQCGEANVGINLDLFHYYTGPSKFEDLALLTPANLFHVQISDLAGTPRELANDGDRILPGDGDFQLKPILAHLKKMPYEGWISLELMNQTLWRANPAQVAEIGITALRKILADL